MPELIENSSGSGSDNSVTHLPQQNTKQLTPEMAIRRGEQRRKRETQRSAQIETKQPSPVENQVPVMTRSGRVRKEKGFFDPAPASHREQARQQKRDTETLNSEWQKRKETDHQVRDSNNETAEEHAKFCEANKYYKMFYEKATDHNTEFMYSSATRPEFAPPGSIEELILSVKDPKQVKHIHAMDSWNQERYNNATAAEKEKFFKDPKVAERVRITEVPAGVRIKNTLCIWVTKWLHGKYDKTKARIVVRGDQDPKGVHNTFAPTVRFTSMLVLFCLAAMFGWRIDKIDYTGAFLNANLPEPMYARLPHGIREYDSDGTEFVIKFHKAAYGIATAPRLWHQTQDAEFRDLGYYQHRSDSCVYSQSWTPKHPSSNLKAIFGPSSRGENGKSTNEKFNRKDFCILGNHVDDGAIITPNAEVAAREKKRFFRKYAGTDEGLLTDFCGVRVQQHSKGIDLDQQAYIESVANEYNCLDCKPVRSPIEKPISQEDCPEEVNHEVQKKFWKICGQLMYVCTHTRPDISYAMNQLTRVAHRPHRLHLAQAHHLLRYLVTTRTHKMKFHRATKLELDGYNYMDPKNFEGYADSSYADCKTTAKSSAGHVFFLGKHQACVEAIAKMVPDVGNSSTENEYITLSRAAQSGFYIKQFIDELGIFDLPAKYKIYEDNNACLNALKKNVATSKFRHLRTRWHYLRDLVRDQHVQVRKVPTADCVADVFTKCLFGTQLEKFTGQILGHIPRDHTQGEKLDMDYQPHMDQQKQEVHIKPAYAKILKHLDIKEP